MRRRDERLRPRDVSDAWSIYYFALNDNGALTSDALLAVLPPTEHLLTLRWAFDETHEARNPACCKCAITPRASRPRPATSWPPEMRCRRSEPIPTAARAPSATP